MRILLSCVNSAVSLVGYDFEERRPFWYCPGNVLRACGASVGEDRLWVASDNSLACLSRDGVSYTDLPGPHENLAHSVKILGENLLAVADTGNSRILLRPEVQSGARGFYQSSPLEGWEPGIPADAIHLNDLIPWQDGVLASAFSYQPFSQWKKSGLDWQSEGWGSVFYLRRNKGRTVSRIVATGLNCPHSLCHWQDCVYCCSSAHGEFYRFRPDAHGLLREEQRWKVTSSHFLRGVLRTEKGWVLGGSSRRYQDDGGGMVLFFLDDNGVVETLPVARVGEIYDILPWNGELMSGVAQTLLRLPDLGLEGEFPARCVLPE